MQARPNRYGLSNYNYQGDSPTLPPSKTVTIFQRTLTKKFESSVQIVGFVFGSLLCTTEVSNFHENLHSCQRQG